LFGLTLIVDTLNKWRPDAQIELLLELDEALRSVEQDEEGAVQP
jgi:hypothetical protein